MKRATKVRVCGCGHEETHHALSAEGKILGCTYGAGAFAGGCDCTSFHSHRRGSPKASTKPPTSPLSKALTALDKAEAAIKEAREVLLDRWAGETWREPAPVVRLVSPKERPAVEAGEIGKGAIRMLTAIAQHGAKGVTRPQLTALTGYKRSTRDAYIQRLVNAQYVDIQYGRIVVRQAGLDRLGPSFKRLPTGSALYEHWRQRLPAGECLVLEVLVRAYPSWVQREKISDATGFARSTRDAYLQRLNARELIVLNRASVGASAMLFDATQATS